LTLVAEAVSQAFAARDRQRPRERKRPYGK
jgi:hypothetical protein